MVEVGIKEKQSDSVSYAPLRVFVVDRSMRYRKIISDILNGIPNVEVVGTFATARNALRSISVLQPDLLTLEVEMPEMSGLDVLAWIREEDLDIGAIMVSSLHQQPRELTVRALRALELGAFDFIPKPEFTGTSTSKEALADALLPSIIAFAKRRRRPCGAGGGTTPVIASPIVSRKPEIPGAIPELGKPIYATGGLRADVVAIGISTGGPNALSQVLPLIPKDLGVPILIVQHMPPNFTQCLAESLNAKCAIEVREALNSQPLAPNTVFIAPGGKQMKVVGREGGKDRIIRITDDPPENSCKPSADYLFRSIAHLYKDRAVGVIMTGMGSDGMLGLRLMKQSGARIIAQNEASCVVYGMPKGPVDAGIVDAVVPLPRIAAQICKMVRS